MRGPVMLWLLGVAIIFAGILLAKDNMPLFLTLMGCAAVCNVGSALWMRKVMP